MPISTIQDAHQNGGSTWDALDDLKYQNEDIVIGELLSSAPLSVDERATVGTTAVKFVQAARTSAKRKGLIENFLQEFSLDTREGLALMCLAEALLRTPDTETRDQLIAEKIASANWAIHAGQSDSLFVNASTWGLMLTGRLIDVDDEARHDPGSYLKRLTLRLGEPVIRQAVMAAVRIMGEQFVLGASIGKALSRARREKMLCSFDMLGEGARTQADAARYERLYAQAITAVGEASNGAGPEAGHGISVKLSALSPRYEAVQEKRVWEELYPRLKRLALIAAKYDLNFAIDAEEADRLTLSLKLLDRLACEPELAGWTGLGYVVQAYQKRGRAVIAGLKALSLTTGRRIMVRLVKGAYWDSEIKRAQVAGRPDYPVFTTKAATDLSYLVCAAALLEASPALYPQFATHNAHTLASVLHMAKRAGVRIEHQRLHGMGEALYRGAAHYHDDIRVRAYAPVGGHEELLPYLVRRLLENGANTSFVHALLNTSVPVEMVVGDPIAQVEAQPHRHPKIPLTADIYGPTRRNPEGRDYSIAKTRKDAQHSIKELEQKPIDAGPVIDGRLIRTNAGAPVVSPIDCTRIVGHVYGTGKADIDKAVTLARKAQPGWDRWGGAGRAQVLRAMSDALEAKMDDLVALLALEAGKTLNDGVAEVREAIDFCRYYAHLAETQFGAPVTLEGPAGETNRIELRGRGIFACISPWNFPLAIFTGQIAAALAAGNAVLAKPAEQTPLIAAEAVRLFHQAGLPPSLLALLPGDGSMIGAALVTHPEVDGVAFTGGTDTARAINNALAARKGPILPFIAETGGLNAMFVDTTALKEQVVDDVILSAFGSAGQRCSALRILFVPKDSADALITTLCGSLDALVIGDPTDPATDVGPVIDQEAHAKLEAHVERLANEAKILHRATHPPGLKGSYFMPVIAEIPVPDYLESEVFGPVLHIYRYDPADLTEIAQRHAARGYGLTLGIHSRIEGFAAKISELVPAGNVYVNRSIIGAVVGVQPFGGEGLSGTGPKAGGPQSLLRYAVERATSVNIAAQGGDAALFNL